MHHSVVVGQTGSANSFDTARQLGAVYALFAEEDLRTLLSGFVDQAKAMSMLFAAAGGLIESQDEAVAAALGKAAQEPAGMQSLGLLAAVGPVLSPTGLSVAAVADAVGSSGYDRGGPEDVSGARWNGWLPGRGHWTRHSSGRSRTAPEGSRNHWRALPTSCGANSLRCWARPGKANSPRGRRDRCRG